VPASERTAQPGEASFREQDVSMPIREEEVEIQKRPVVKEEVRLQKERFTEQRAADADVRKERVELEGDEERRHLSQDRGGLTEPTSPGIAPRRDEDGIP
jgi:stress response protein YsnF